MSSEVGAVFTLTLQPVAFSNGVTQSTAGSVEPSSAYPAQATMLRAPSGVPSLSSALRSGGVKPWGAASLPVAVGALSLLPPLLPPQAASASNPAAPSATILVPI